MTGYSVSISSASIELSAKDKIRLKDTTNATALDEATKSGKVTITPAYWAELCIHNEKSEDKDYQKYIIVATDGEKYITGSNSMWSAFMGIFDEMADAGETDYQVEVYRMPSKNYKGKEFLTCSVV